MSAQTKHVRATILPSMMIYVGIAAMSLLGISGLTSSKLQLITLGLCLLFVLLFRFVYQSGLYLKNPTLYFGTQTLILMLTLVAGLERIDAFNFLFIILALHVAVILPGKQAVIWIVFYEIFVSSMVIYKNGLANGLYAILFYLVGYVVVAYLGYALRQMEMARDRNQKLVDELKETQEKLRELAVVEERNRLARDLHDSVKQQVFAISMQLSAARTALSESDKAYPSLTEAERLAQQAGTELTSLINALRPPALGEKSLPEAINEYVEEWSRQNHIEVKMNVDPKIIVDEKVEQTLFRVLQEALANVTRHSQANKVNVELKSESSAVVLTVEDNGIGFDAKQIAKGIGLDSMQERLLAVNGKVDVESEKSKGTRVIARVRRS